MLKAMPSPCASCATRPGTSCASPPTVDPGVTAVEVNTLLAPWLDEREAGWGPDLFSGRLQGVRVGVPLRSLP